MRAKSPVKESNFGCGIRHASMSHVRAIENAESQRISITFSSVGVRAFLACVMVCVFLVRTDAQVITAASANWYDVSNACAEASNGWTVIVPPGTDSWNAGITITNKGIFLKGAGYYVYSTNYNDNPWGANTSGADTCITNELTTGAALISVYLDNSNLPFFRISGFHFECGSSNANFDTGDQYPNVAIGGTDFLTNNSEWEVDHCWFNLLTGPNVTDYGWNGLIDSCFFNQYGNGDAISIHPSPLDIHGNNEGDEYGNVSYANPIAIGTEDEGLYVEDCYFTNNSYRGAVDVYGGGKCVFRHNWVERSGAQIHGTDTSGPYRSGRWLAVYDNVFSSYTMGGGVVWARGGTGVIFSNTCSGPWPALLSPIIERMNMIQITFTNAYGLNPFDDNVTNANGTVKIFASGVNTAGSTTAGSDLVMTDPTAHWTPNQWVGYSICNSNAIGSLANNSAAGGIVLTNDATSITVFNMEGGAGPFGPGDLFWTNGDIYLICQINHALDQPGVGQGNLLTTHPPGPLFTPVAWPQEVDTPWWMWGNTSNGVVLDWITNVYNVNQSDEYYCVTPGRNFTNGVDMAYVQLQYPDPWTTNYTTNAISPPTPLPPTNLRATPLAQ